MKIKALALSVVLATTGLSSLEATAGTATKYPVIFAHGMVGYDGLIAGMNIGQYFANDAGVFVGTYCASLAQKVALQCNPDIPAGQISAAFRVSFLNNSEVRGLQLANYVRTYCTATLKPGTTQSVCLGTDGKKRVNLVGHSQGGMDIRKASVLLQSGPDPIYTGALISISSPHRGAEMAVAGLNNIKATSKDSVDFATRIASWMVPGVPLVNLSQGVDSQGNAVDLPQDAKAAAYAMVYDDYDGNVPARTGAKLFNQNYPVAATNASFVGSIVTRQSDASKNPALLAMSVPAGVGADDGLVNIGSQQMGFRLSYAYCAEGDAICRLSTTPKFSVVPETSAPYVGDLNNPPAAARTSTTGILNQDHFDVMGYGPDLLNEHEMYAALMDFIAQRGL